MDTQNQNQNKKKRKKGYYGKKKWRKWYIVEKVTLRHPLIKNKFISKFQLKICFFYKESNVNL